MRHIAVGGAAENSLAYLGAHLALSKVRREIENIVCVSGGCFLAILCSLQLSMEDLRVLKPEINALLLEFKRIMDVPMYIKAIRVFFLMGAYDFRTRIQPLVSVLLFTALRLKGYNKESMTISEWCTFTGIQIHILSTSMSDCNTFVFNSANTPDVQLLQAISASMCIQLLFKPYEIDGIYYTDGGLSNNFPVGFFDVVHGEANPETFGLHIYNSPRPINVNAVLPARGFRGVKIWLKLFYHTLLKQVTFSPTANFNLANRNFVIVEALDQSYGQMASLLHQLVCEHLGLTADAEDVNAIWSFFSEPMREVEAKSIDDLENSL